MRGASEDLGDQQLRRTVRQRGEHDVETAEVGDVVGRAPKVAVRRPERRIEIGHRRARVGVGRDVHDLDLGMACEQPQQFGPRVP